MAGYILGGEEKNLVLRCAEVDAVIGGKNGDAALLYLALQRSSGGQDAAALAASLGMTELRLRAAESALRDMGLLGGGKPLAPARERTEFTPQEMAELLGQEDYAMLRAQVEQTLGRRLAAADDQVLAGLYHDLGFPADVLYQLVVHCTERTRRRYGEGRRPTLRQIEKEGYYWAQRGLMDQDAVAAYLRDYDRKMTGAGAYMRVLQLGERQPVEKEMEYILDWMDKGFPPDSVAMAYEITVMRKQRMVWGYLNGILRRWHEKGWHTPSQVEQGERRRSGASRQGKTHTESRDKSWMKKYVKGE